MGLGDSLRSIIVSWILVAGDDRVASKGAGGMVGVLKPAKPNSTWAGPKPEDGSNVLTPF